MYVGTTVAGVYSSFAAAQRKAPASGGVVIVRHQLDDELYATFQQVHPPLRIMGPVKSFVDVT